jgi:hypothetical protein
MPYKDPEQQKKAQHKHYLAHKKKYKVAARRSKPKFKYNRALWIQQIKSKLMCNECGESRIPCLDFHHRNPDEKDMNIGRAVWCLSKERVLLEIQKCDVLCKNCHAYLHWKESHGT